MKECRRGGVYFTSNTECRKGSEDAEKALKMTIEERLALVVEHKMSDEEEEMEIDEFDGMYLKNVRYFQLLLFPIFGPVKYLNRCIHG